MSIRQHSETTNIFNLTYGELGDCMDEWGEPPYRARQIWHALYQRLVDSFDEISNLPLSLRRRLSGHFRIGSLQHGNEMMSEDGRSRKYLFTLIDNCQIEAVLMRYQGRCTACISTQVGCAIGCVFCATGQMGLFRNLNYAEIAEQALWFARKLRLKGESLTNVVFMGMGEPFHNYDATVAALDRITDVDGFNLGARRITVSTVGLVPMILRFANDRRREKLAVSLHAATDQLRSQIVPINKRYPLSELIPACHKYLQLVRRRITFEWVLIQGVNDTQEQAQALIHLVKGMLCHINIIPLNQTDNYDHAPATHEAAIDFTGVLTKAGVSCTIRVPRGPDISAACGQLSVRTVPPTPFDRPVMSNIL